MQRQGPQWVVNGPSAQRIVGDLVAVLHCTPYDRKIAFFADSRLVLLNNCGHWPPFEKPAEWTARVLAFPHG
jgi:pimeloyl-ACP methyl ester carboxylesterase